jgi:hypothetical protein
MMHLARDIVIALRARHWLFDERVHSEWLVLQELHRSKSRYKYVNFLLALPLYFTTSFSFTLVDKTRSQYFCNRGINAVILTSSCAESSSTASFPVSIGFMSSSSNSDDVSDSLVLLNFCIMRSNLSISAALAGPSGPDTKRSWGADTPAPMRDLNDCVFVAMKSEWRDML